MAFAELRAEAFEGRHLLLVERHDTVGRGLLQSHQPVMLAEQAVGAVGLEVTADLVELLAAVADDAAGLADDLP